MKRNYKSGMTTNNTIKYNSITNSKTTQITIINNEKINSKKIYDFSVSHKKMKEMNYRSKYCKITADDLY
jgi:hypothetical protein